MNASHSANTNIRALYRIVFVFALVAVLYPRAARAQEAQRITFNDAVRIALEYNPLLKQAANQVENRSIMVSRERMDFFPTLSFSSNGGQNYGRNFIMHEGRVVNNTTEYFSVSSRFSINVFNGFADVASLKGAELEMEASELDYERARQTVAFDVMQSYIELVSLREQIRVQDSNLVAQQRQLEQIRAFTEVGSRPISDLYQQEAEVANAELQVVNAQRAYQIAEANLIQILHLDPFNSYEFVAPSLEDIEITPERLELEQMLQEAFAQRVDLQATERTIDAAEQEIRVSRALRLPVVSLGANYGTNYSTAVPDELGFGLWDQFDQNRGGGLSLSLSLPIFDRFTTRHAVQQARVQFDNARLELEKLQQNIAVQVRQAYLDYLLAQKTLDVTEKQLQSAELALEAANERYRVQATTLVEVTQANANYVRALTDRVNARYDFLFRSKLIDYYLGKLDPSEPLF